MAEVEADDVDPGPRASLASDSGRRLAGPSVATIFVRRVTPAYLVVDGRRRRLGVDLRSAAYLDASPSPWHAVASACRRLEPPGSSSSTSATLGRRPGGRVTSCVAARWSPGDGRRRRDRAPFRIVGAHTDSPGLRVKPQPRHGARRLAPARRRGLRRRPPQQLARPRPRRGRAGRARPTASRRSSRVDEPVARVPQLAIHLDRDVNERGLVLDRQAHLRPVWATELALDVRAVAGRAWPARRRTGVVGARASTTSSRPRVLGADRSLLASGRLDNLVSCWAATTALVAADAGGETSP